MQSNPSNPVLQGEGHIVAAQAEAWRMARPKSRSKEHQ